MVFHFLQNFLHTTYTQKGNGPPGSPKLGSPIYIYVADGLPIDFKIDRETGGYLITGGYTETTWSQNKKGATA